MKSIPNYRLLYEDMIRIKYPEKYNCCIYILKKKEWTVIDIIKINDIIAGSSSSYKNNQKFKVYDKKSIFNILDCQKRNNMTNTQTAAYFKLSRNTLAKWKREFF